MGYTPSWYDSRRCGTLFLPDMARAAATGAEYAASNGIEKQQRWQNATPSWILSVIDCQIDFIHPDGALCVPGAVEDTDNLNRFVLDHIPQLAHLIASLDSHYLYQPFHPLNWVAGAKPPGRADGTAYQDGDHPDPFTIISLTSVHDGSWVPVRNPVEMLKMLRTLEEQGNKKLCIWPYHCLLGTTGHAWEPTFAEVMAFHAAARGNQYDATIKGMSQLSEHYGILQAEVQFPSDIKTHLNTRVLNAWEQAERVYFAGQAKSHCCLETIEQVIKLFTAAKKNHLLEKMFILTDCMSSVADISLPDGNVIEFDKMTEERFAEMEKLGVKFVKSTDPV